MITPLFIGTSEIVIIAGVILLLFGGKKLPEMMRGLGQGMKEFKKGMKDSQNETGLSEDGEENKDTEAINKEGTKELAKA